MPAIAAVLTELITTKIDTKMKAIEGHSPLAGKEPKYYMALCKAVADGIANGTTVINFVTDDSGTAGLPPWPGAGTGVGIMVDDEYFAQSIYTKCRTQILSMYEKSNNIEYPPTDGTNGMYLLALAQGIAEAVKEHFATAWTLTSVNPFVYMGEAQVKNGNFSGIDASLVQSLILNDSPLLSSGFWPTMCQIIADAYVDTIMNQSTASLIISGVCIVSLAQTCGIPITDVPGHGVAN